MNSKESKHTINILWTGGYDSSFRMAQLSKKAVIVQPYYLSDNRHSEKNELNAIAEITKDLESHPDTKFTLLPLIVYKVCDIKVDEEITAAHRNLRKNITIGPQYEWLARFAKESKIQGLELSIEKSEDDLGPITTTFIRSKSEPIFIENEITSYYRLDKKSANPEVYIIFGQFHLPIYHITKLDMLSEYKKLGFEHIINKTWFCHTPIRGKPCGICVPCKTVIDAKMEFRIPKSGLLRNKINKFAGKNKHIGKMFKKLKLI